jgi:chromosomal replication initiator protein
LGSNAEGRVVIEGQHITLRELKELVRTARIAIDAAAPKIIDIQQAVAEAFGIRLIDMTSARRARSVARPRQVAMYLARQLTLKSLPQIGRAFGDRDHTTVMHAIKQVEILASLDPDFGERIVILRERLGVARDIVIG